MNRLASYCPSEMLISQLVAFIRSSEHDEHTGDVLLTSVAVQLFPNSCGVGESMLSGVRISFTVFKSKFPHNPLSFP